MYPFQKNKIDLTTKDFLSCLNKSNFIRRLFLIIAVIAVITGLTFINVNIVLADAGDAANSSTADNTTVTDSVKIKLAAGFQHSAMIDYDGKLYVWGDNTYGQLGLPDEAYIDTPTELSLPEQVREISLGAWHTLLLTESGKVYAMGRNTFGQLGNGTFENSNMPVLLEGLPVVTKISAGSYHSLVLTETGSVWGWGNNTTYQLAQAESDELQQDDGQIVARRVPRPEIIIENNVVDIAGGGHFSLSLSEQGMVSGWGENSKGQLGNGTDQLQQFPLEISDLSEITSIYAGYEYALAVSELEQMDTLFAWGDHSLGQLGASELPGSGTSRLRPVRIDLTDDQIAENDRLLLISAGYAHVVATVPETAVIKSDDTNEEVFVTTGRQKLLVWGSNAYGQLGLGTNKSHYKPAVISGEFDGYEGSSFLPFDAAAAGGSHTLVMSSKGQLAASGQGSRGQLGTVSIIDRDVFTLVETKDLILPVWAENQALSAEFDENNDFLIRWPAAQDNLSVAGYKIIIESESGQKQILESGENTERFIKNMNPDEAFAIAVYAYDEANAELETQDLSVMYGAWNPGGYSSEKWVETFSQPINGVSAASLWPHNWMPDITGQRQPLEVPWSQISIYGEKLTLPSEPFPLAKAIAMAVIALIIVLLAVLIGINFHKKRQLYYPIPRPPEGIGSKLKTKLRFLSTIRNFFTVFFAMIKKTVANIFRKHN